MAKKEKTSFPLPGDLGHSFDREDDILNFRPKIAFVEPPQEFTDQTILNKEEPTDTIDNFRQRTEDLIKGYKAVQGLAEQAQKRLDNRVQAAGGFRVQLDPAVDGHVIAAMKRAFPDKADPTIIDYDDYKKCLEDMRNSAPPAPAFTQGDLKSAQTDPLRTDFGGAGNQQGENRPEKNSPANSVKPLDLGAFQAAAVVALFGLLLPMIKNEDKAEIALHLSTTPHGPF